MIVQKVVVQEVNGESILLSPVSQGCTSCKSNQCGAASLASLFGNKNHSLSISNPGIFLPGEEAELLLSEKFFLKTVALQYLLPLLMIFIAVTFMGLLSDSFLLQALSALVGLIGGIAISRYWINGATSLSSADAFRIRKIIDTSDGEEAAVQVLMS